MFDVMEIPGQRGHACAQGKLRRGLLARKCMLLLQPVLLSGGSGTRLWPLSREAYPKQFLPLAGDDTMVQATWRRVAPLASAAPIVVANEEHRFLVAEQLRQIAAPVPAILLEPVGRNTAPAIAAAALHALAGGQDSLLLVLPSDHVVRDPERSRK
jgi:mannose-1-phosphate guanylyltransferase/mannose-6-phosphate isomerase